MTEWLAGNRIIGTSDERNIYTNSVTLDGEPQKKGDSNTGTTNLSISINVGDHANKALIVCVTQQSGSTTSVSVGGTNLVKIVDTQGGDGNGSQRTEIWRLLDADITNNASNQVDWNGTSGSPRLSLAVYSLYNVNQNVSGNFVSSEAYGTASTTTGVVNSVDSEDLILDVLSANSSTKPINTLTEGYNVFISSNRYAVSQYNSSPSTNNNMFYSNVTGAEWAWSGVRIKPAITIPVGIPHMSGGWKEVGRTTLGSNNAELDVSGLPDKRYYMILSNTVGKTNAGANGIIKFNGDNGSNYSAKNSNTGAADDPQIGTSGSFFNQTGGNFAQYEVAYLSNLSTKEKLWTGIEVQQNATGINSDSKVPFTNEHIGKWSNTSDAINEINNLAGGSDLWLLGSEIIILGWDETDTHTANFWEELASVELDSAGDTLDSGTIPAKKYLWFQVYTEGANTETQFKFNSTTGQEYASNRSGDGGGYSKFKSEYQSKINATGGASHTACFMNGFIINNPANEKLVITRQVAVEQTGSATAPRRSEGVTKWSNASDSITSIQIINNNSTGNFGTNSILKVWGSN